ncbi:MAG TPA: prephenate dehydrogenase [Acidimicrobiia bacterium]|nr:prephenate dehydrogenase [Acidimicrobiia bacterium]
MSGVTDVPAAVPGAKMGAVTSDFKTFGIVGYGHLGQLLARSLAEHGKVLVTDVDETRLEDVTEGVRVVALDEVVGADAVILAVPYGALEGLLEEIRGQLGPDTVVMDVVSTKAHATALLRRILDEHTNVLATHPLFGPPSMTRLAPGLRIVVTYEKGERAAAFQEFLTSQFGLEMVHISAEEHDRAMAYMQSLPFFIARALVRIDLLGMPHRDLLAIPSFEKLAEIEAIEEQHTMGMFDTSQVSNPYAEDARRRFLEVLRELQAEIEQHASAADLPPAAPGPDAPPAQ